MVNVTEHAKEALLLKKRAAHIDDPDIGLRLAARDGGKLGLVPDRPKAGDEVVRHADSTVLLVDPEVSALVLAGRTVDCRRTDDGDVQVVVRQSSGRDPRR